MLEMKNEEIKQLRKEKLEKHLEVKNCLNSSSVKGHQMEHHTRRNLWIAFLVVLLVGTYTWQRW